MNNMSEMSRFYEAMALVTSLPKDLQDKFTSELRNSQRQGIINELNIGNIVKINHKRIPSNHQFRVEKINRKNVKVKNLDSNAVFTVSPTLLEVIQ